MVILTFEILNFQFIEFISTKCFQRVPCAAEAGLIVDEKLRVHRKISVMRYHCLTVDRGSASELAVQSVVSFIFVQQSDIAFDGQTLDRCDGHSELSGNHVCIGFLAVDLIVSNGIADDIGTYEIGLIRVVHLHAVLIHDIALGVPDVKRVDRTHVVRDVEYIA